MLDSRRPEEVSLCANTESIQIMIPASIGNDIKRSATEIADAFPHFRAFVAAVTERVNARLAKGKLCIKSAESTDGMESAEFNQRSLLQFVH
jgi:hypothetical protein